ncbi:transglutaminase domain-containing protein [Longibacter salinarum]|nr:transglutaminase domain-containing protein [Longibacter salinarum]
MSLCTKHVRYLRPLLIAISLLGISVTSGHTQPVEPGPAEWKEISDAELDFTEYPADSNATAVILSDVGRLEISRRDRFRLERSTRVKLLDEAAFDEHGTVSLTYRSAHNREDVRSIEGHTFVRSDDGSIQLVEIHDNDIFEEEIRDGVHRVTFTLPNLEPGAVIEYRYESYSKDVLSLPTWHFQSSEPTVYSEYETRIPNWLDYIIMTHGSNDFDEKTDREVMNERRKRWVATNIPALRAEPFITTLENYRMSLTFQLNRYKNPRTGQERHFITSWPTLAEMLIEDPRLGEQLGRHGNVNDRVESIVDHLKSKEEKMQAIYSFVANTMNWDGRSSAFASKGGLDDALERGRGTTGDINLLLCSMLRIAGIDAYPVLISTRSNGAPMPIYPFLSQFNSVIVQLEIDDEPIFLDATSPARPMGMLPYRALNGQGWKIAAKPTWIPIPPTATQFRSSLIRASISPSGDVSANVSVTNKSISAVRNRERLAEAESPQAFIRDALLDSEADVKDVTTSGLTVDDPNLQTSATVTLPSYAQVAGDTIYLNPVIIGRPEENPLKAETRSFPVDFGYPRQSIYTLSLMIPEGWEIAEMPENKVVEMTDNVAFQRIVQANDQVISMRIIQVLNSTRFAPDVYDKLRGYFEDITAAQNEPIVLKRTTEDGTSESR